MQAFLQIVAFSLQTDGSGWPVLTKGKRPKIMLCEVSDGKRLQKGNLFLLEYPVLFYCNHVASL